MSETRMEISPQGLGAEITLRPSNGAISDYLALLKPRVMSLVIFTAFVGLIIAPGNVHPWIAAIGLLCIAVGAGASGALNMWYDADIDSVMQRTAKRPIPRGTIEREDALTFGLILSIGSVLVLGVLVNWAAASLLAFTIFFYAVIYTMWLKRRTPQNIVIGGAAGAFPPMIGWTVVTGSIDLISISLFAITFLWTPPHFWALALYRRGDYENAGLPMLPVVAGTDETRQQILIYSIAMVPASLAPLALGLGGWFYGLNAAVFSGLFLYYAVQVYRIRHGVAADHAARRLFRFSLWFLFAVFAAFLVEWALAIPPLVPIGF